MLELSNHGFHYGYWTIDDCDVILRKCFGSALLEEEKLRLLNEWLNFVDREGIVQGLKSALWHESIPEEDYQLIRSFLGDRLIEIKADNLKDALHQFYISPWAFGVFYHVACMPGWKLVVEEQLGLLSRSGISGVHVSFLGTQTDLDYFLQRAARARIDVWIVFRDPRIELFELPAIRMLQEWALQHPKHYVLYFHTKGASNPNSVLKIHWRRLMQEWVIARWRENSALLRDGASIVGVNWQDHPSISHYPGNFWMARADYLNSLESFGHYYRHPRHSAGNHVNQWRLGAEFWIGSGVSHPKLKSHVTFGDQIDAPTFWRTPRPGISGYLALCLWCKDEHAYIAEWLDYHFGLGVDHVIIYDNNSTPPLAESLLSYLAQGRVTILHDSDKSQGRQCRAYARCLTDFGGQFRWIGFIDTDEFVVPRETRSLPVFLRQFEGCGGLGVFWYCFGSNGHSRRQKSVVQSYLRRSDDEFEENDHIKTFVNTSFVTTEIPLDPHHFRYIQGKCCVDEEKEPICSARRRPRVSRLIQLNHYITRSDEEWIEKLARGGGNSVVSRPADFAQKVAERCNRVHDDGAAELARIFESKGK